MKIDLDAVKHSRGLVERGACKRLAQLAKQVRTSHAIVELGAYCGRTTGWLVSGSRGAHVWSVDPWDGIAADAVNDEYASHEPNYRNGKYLDAYDQWRAHMAACGIDSAMATPLRSTAVKAAKRWDGGPVGLLFHDAVHSYVAVVEDLTAWLPHLATRATVALHDLGYAGYGVEPAAHDVLASAGFDWKGRERLLWKKDPTRRGLLVVHRGRQP